MGRRKAAPTREPRQNRVGKLAKSLAKRNLHQPPNRTRPKNPIILICALFFLHRMGRLISVSVILLIRKPVLSAGIAEHGQRRRLQEPILQRFVGSNPTPCTTQEHLNLRDFLLSTTTLTEATINRRVKSINYLCSNADLFNADQVLKFLNQSKWKNGTKNIALQAYRDFQRMYGLEPVSIRKYHVIQQLP